MKKIAVFLLRWWLVLLSVFALIYTMSPEGREVLTIVLGGTFALYCLLWLATKTNGVADELEKDKGIKNDNQTKRRE